MSKEDKLIGEAKIALVSAVNYDKNDKPNDALRDYMIGIDLLDQAVKAMSLNDERRKPLFKQIAQYVTRAEQLKDATKIEVGRSLSLDTMLNIAYGEILLFFLIILCSPIMCMYCRLSKMSNPLSMETSWRSQYYLLCIISDTNEHETEFFGYFRLDCRPMTDVEVFFLVSPLN
ncbi:unnamed protein product [Strongylus vulgaris]|uniref:MIT domain-containing protein n=1 Tax=Strongylus vulgaris TaxID=40348 RepID=A0A3P7IQ45_STRVU|nr:unnamed protein product [Strongylus vulgaris]